MTENVTKSKYAQVQERKERHLEADEGVYEARSASDLQSRSKVAHLEWPARAAPSDNDLF